MRFILRAGALTDLKFLRPQYQKIKQVNLDEKPSFIGRPIFLGGTDVASRNIQSNFLRKIRIMLNANLMKAEDIKTYEEYAANLRASQTMLAACLYVQSQITKPRSNSALYQLINNDLGITDTNYLDDEDKQACYRTANWLINSARSRMDEANAAIFNDPWYTLSLMSDDTIMEPDTLYLKEIDGKIAYSVMSPAGEPLNDIILDEVPKPESFTLGELNHLKESILKITTQKGHTQARLSLFSYEEWEQFSEYLGLQCKNKSTASFPITSITKPLFGAAFSYVAASIGALGGDMVSQTTSAMPSKLRLTAYIGSTILLFSPGPLGPALFSQIIAGKIITTLCTISLASVMRTVGEIIGQAIGIGIGVPLDLAFNLIWKALSIIGNYFNSHTNPTDLTGIRIEDGAMFLQGIEIKVNKPSDTISADCVEVDLKTISDPDAASISAGQSSTTATELPPELVKQLEAEFKSFLMPAASKENPEITESTSALTI